MAARRGFKADLARKMGVAPSLIQRYLDDERTPGIDQLDKFADALGIEPWELIKPDGALPTPNPQKATLLKAAEDLSIAIKRLDSDEIPDGLEDILVALKKASPQKIALVRDLLGIGLKVEKKKKVDERG